jgi:GNAT superfamily N-acetyltransferase
MWWFALCAAKAGSRYVFDLMMSLNRSIHDRFAEIKYDKPMEAFSFSMTEDTEGSDAKRIGEGLLAYNDSKVEVSRQKNFVIAAKDSQGDVVAGVKAHTLRGWLYIHQLWVSEPLRSTGLGARLMKMAEEEAISRQCIGAYLNTYSFQALDFYRKQGYEVFGELEDFPVGHKNLFLKKRLAD